jgi:Flp pilus assembly protein TadB
VIRYIRDPFSRPPLAGSVSDRPWVQRNASLFSPREALGVFKAVVVFFLLAVAVPLVCLYYGLWVGVVFVYVLAAAFVIRAWRRRRRRRP